MTKNATNNIGKGISFYLDVTFRFEMLEDQEFSKRLFQLDKGLSNIKNKETASFYSIHSFCKVGLG